MTYDELIRDLWGLGHAQGMCLGLERVAAAAQRLGRPADAYPAVHVAGTNGKGSVSHVAARILRAHGLRVGLTTSPHLHRLTERIRIADEEIARDDLARIATEAHARLGGWAAHGLTFFEVVTLLAFEAFRRRAVDVAVAEVGLGGRLDATRLCRPAVSVITTIGLDHTEVLGPTLAAIAAEKAGIIVPGVPLVLGALPAEAREVVAGRAQDAGAPVVEYDAPRASFVPGGGMAEAVDLAARINDLPRRAPLPGAHQEANAALAVAAAFVALRGMGRAIAPARVLVPPFTLPGRLETVPGDPPVLLDVGHNPAAAASLAAHVAALGLRPRFVIGMLARKDVDGFARALGAPDRPLHACAPAMPEAHSPERIAAAWPGPAAVHRSVVDALAAARVAARGSGETVVVTGSHFTVAEARADLLGIADVDRPIGL